MHWLGIGLIGLLGGVASGLFGVGGGVIFVPLLIIFFNFNPHLAIGTSLVVIIPTALAGAFRHFAAKSVDFQTAAILILFAVLGAWFGAGISLKLDAVMLRKLYALFLLGVAARLFFKS